MKPARLHLLEDNMDNVTPGTPAGAGQASDDSLLRAKAREAIEAGNLPNRRPDRMWGGPGDGAQCTICGAPVKQDELELEMEFTLDAGPGPSKHHVHIRCFSALEFELRKHELAGGAVYPSDQAPSSHPVSMGSARRCKDGDIT